MKQNKTHELLQQNSVFALSVLPQNIDANIIDIFGRHSSRKIDKFETISTKSIKQVNIISDSLGYMICEKVDAIENETHTLFIGKLIEADVLQEGEAMSYQYYQEHKTNWAEKKEQGKTAWVCKACGYVYYGSEVPDDFKCPLCGMDSSYFIKEV